MGRGEPTYDLEELQRLIGQGRISSVVTRTAADGATALNLNEDDIEAAVLSLEAKHFYKSMESEQRAGLWQDVYHLRYGAHWLYIKLQILSDGRASVVQFKQK